MKKPPNLPTLLTFRRPGGSKTEKLFIETFIDSVPGMKRDGFGNRYIRVGKISDSNVMFSVHTDSVHWKDGFQKIAVDKTLRHYILNDPDSNCLGSDDATGVYMALKMIYMKRPGLYVFHREEETGGSGSIFFAGQKDKYKGIQQIIALDRKGYNNVITHQGGRCCSQEYALALSEQLGMGFAPDNTGVFTDSANYVKDVPECTNLSVGYFRQHSKDEYQDMDFPDKLIAALVSADLENLPIKRDPSVYEPYGYQRWGGYDGRYSTYSEKYGASQSGKGRYATLSIEALLEYVWTNPEGAARVMHEMGVSQSDLDEEAERQADEDANEAFRIKHGVHDLKSTNKASAIALTEFEKQHGIIY